MGRQKIRIEYIENKSNRVATFRKRSAGLMKKADELHVLCGAEVTLTMEPQDSGGNPKEYSSNQREKYLRCVLPRQQQSPKKGNNSNKQISPKKDNQQRSAQTDGLVYNKNTQKLEWSTIPRATDQRHVASEEYHGNRTIDYPSIYSTDGPLQGTDMICTSSCQESRYGTKKMFTPIQGTETVCSTSGNESLYGARKMSTPIQGTETMCSAPIHGYSTDDLVAVYGYSTDHFVYDTDVNGDIHNQTTNIYVNNETTYGYSYMEPCIKQQLTNHELNHGVKCENGDWYLSTPEFEDSMYTD